METENDSSTLFKRHWAMYRARVYEQYLKQYPPEETRTPLGQRFPPEVDQPTILVVEDNPDEWFLIRWTLLQQFPDAACIWCRDADEVKRYLKIYGQSERELPRLILLDLHLPTPEIGLSTLNLFKADPSLQSVPAVIISRYAKPEHIEKALRQAAAAYIVKPMTYQEWLEGFSVLDCYWDQANPLQ